LQRRLGRVPISSPCMKRSAVTPDLAAKKDAKTKHNTGPTPGPTPTPRWVLKTVSYLWPQRDIFCTALQVPRPHICQRECKALHDKSDLLAPCPWLLLIGWHRLALFLLGRENAAVTSFLPHARWFGSGVESTSHYPGWAPWSTHPLLWLLTFSRHRGAVLASARCSG
jgi:hypothetical protein